MIRRVLVGFLFSLVILGLAACGSSNSTKSRANANGGANASACTPGPAISQTADTSSYKIVLDVGPQEMMYTQAQVQAQHLTSGEVMLRGQMVNMGNMGKMGTSGSARHLEAHICNRSTGKVATDLQPAITLVDNSAANMTDRVPSAVMRGTTSGQADLHYGNNVIMPPSRHFTVTVVVGDQGATFHVQTPRAS